ncbi:MAG: insulinase family protein [Rhodospirillales bacterium]|jgi:zinc protease|nr:insulinase family protein [Rhodospirillales bacterium]
MKRLALFLSLPVVFLLALSGPAGAVDVKRVDSGLGFSALLVEDHSNPIIAMRIAFHGGSALDPVEQEGLANLVSGLIDEGAGDLDSQTFQARLEDYSIKLSFSSGADSFRGSLTTLSENREEAFSLLKLALTEPRFDAEPVERIKEQILSGIRQSAEDPNSIAYEELYKTVFAGHPYGRPSEGTLETVKGISVEAMAGFVSRRFALDNLHIGVTGDITPDELKTVLNNIFESLPAHATPWEIPLADVSTDGQALVISKPVPQSAIVFAQRGLLRPDPDFYPAYVMNYILGGGGFISRLYKEVREERGLAYSVYSYLTPMDKAGLYIGGAGTANARVGETLDVVRAQWALMANKGITQDELNNAKTYLTGSYPLRFSSNSKIANMLLGIEMDDLGDDFFDRRNDLVEAVTLADVNRVAATLLDPKSLTFIVVGEPEGL